MNNLRLGTIIPDDDVYRDAVHIAVAPVIAAATLAPGQHVSVQDGAAYGTLKQSIGVVDPFLERSVEKGQRFWLLLYPNTITSLRHEWCHPEFPEDLRQRDIAKSKAWVEHFAKGSLGISIDEAIEAATAYLDHQAYLCHGGDYDGMSVPYEFWDHYEAITGRRVSTNERGSFLTCSC